MKLSDIKLENIKIFTDGEFDILAQCTVTSMLKTMSFLDNYSYVDTVNNNESISCIVSKSEYIDLLSKKNLGIIISENPKTTFFEIHNFISNNMKTVYNFETHIGENTVISQSAVIANKNVKIGVGVIIEENVIIRENVSIGDYSIIRSGCVIGGQGFEFKRNKMENILRVNHCGKVIIGSWVEIKEFSTIHQAVFDWDHTSVSDHSKLDAHTHIGHASKIGKRVLIGSHSNLAGNVTVGDDAYIGPGVTISNRLNIGRGSKVSIGSVVTKNVDDNQIVTGNFAIPHERFIENLKNKL